MKRGDVVQVALRGDIGKPRPAVIVQADVILGTLHTLVCPMTTEIREDVVIRRVLVEPDDGNGLKQTSQIMVDKINLIRRDKCRDIIGQMSADTMANVDQALLVVLGLLRE